MLIFVELFEFIRALNFPGSDLFIVASACSLFLIIVRVKIKIYLWGVYGFLVVMPILYTYTSKRVEFAVIGFTVAIFFFLSHCNRPHLFSLKSRFFAFVFLTMISYVFSIGDPIYEGSRFNSVFFSGNAFINYLLVFACILAFQFRGIFLPTMVSMPLLMIQTKTVVLLLFSNIRFFILSFLLSIPVVWVLGSLLFDRIAWMLQQRGLMYALGAGRVERLVSEMSASFSWGRVLFGSPFGGENTNFEIEFIDIFLDFGFFYTVVLYSASFYVVRRLSGKLFHKILAVFLVLNLGGHFWNNTIVVVAFLALVFYANSYNHKYVP